ncbi:hypothetical protein OZY43_07595 [Lactobacillus sp. ESL0785]|uniref:hypothetical protein n=1 Tax=Lactobacillus sp. ESL0785 TaxID=2983232 RepID=UPI0023F79529|nr:hypothetical protein [Lactobacillus sp. ESL0785]WEV70791.1 hypothetical protein OZY43_07595 [Lactobacillus sp. ESL0785]
MKLILKGNVEQVNDEPLGVVAVVYLTSDVQLAKKKFTELNENKTVDEFYMIYSCPQDTYLPTLSHYPSLEISRTDLGM